MKYHVKWDVKSYSHGKRDGNHPVKMDVKTIIQTTEHNLLFVMMLYGKFMVSALARVKTIKLFIWYCESVHNSVIARVCTSGSHFQSNLLPGSGFCP